MIIRNAGQAIRRARLNIGMTQERLSEGICHTFSLSRIECGEAGVKNLTFRKLMSKTNIDAHVFPVFKSEVEFQCYQSMKRLEYFFHIWHFKEANEELKNICFLNYAKNKFYYQYAELYKGMIHIKSGIGDYRKVYESLQCAWRLTQSAFTGDMLTTLSLSLTETLLIISMAECLKGLGQLDEVLFLCGKIDCLIEKAPYAFREKEYLYAKNAVVQLKALIEKGQFQKAYSIAMEYRHRCVKSSIFSPLHEITLAMAICLYNLGNTEEAYQWANACYYSALSSFSFYSDIIKKISYSIMGITFSISESDSPNISLNMFVSDEKAMMPKQHKMIDSFYKYTYQMGDIIYRTRLNKGITGEQLCKGICAKSFLSKIERGSQMPDKFIMEALLERLGFNKDYFTVYGDYKEYQISEIKYELETMLRRGDRKEGSILVKRMEDIVMPKDIINRQYILLTKASLEISKEVRLKMLKEALTLTLSDFDSKLIDHIILSYNEFAILSKLAETLIADNDNDGWSIAYRLLERLQQDSYNIMIKSHFIPVIMNVLINGLYSKELYKEICYIKNLVRSTALSGQYDYLASLCLCVWKSMDAEDDCEDVALYMNFALSNAKIVEV